MDWDDVRFFLALSRAGSVRAAGAALGVSHSTVARRVETLEEKLKVRLFDRTPDGYVLTAPGTQMVASAERVESEMSTLERELLGQDEKLEGAISITCTDPYLSDIVVRTLAPFCKDYPRVDLEVTTSYRSFDLSKREADIAIRMHRTEKDPPEHLLGKKLAQVYYANYVALSHADKLDPEVPGNQSRWLGWGERKADETWAAKTSYPDVPVWGSFGSIELQRQAAHAGLGIAMLPCTVADRDSKLRRLKKADLCAYYDVWLLSHPDLRDTARLRRARESLTSAFKREQPWFAGDRPSSSPE